MKTLSRFFLVLLLLVIISMGNQTHVYANTYSQASNLAEEPSVWLQSDIIEWRYKTENGKLYKRKYNYTKVKWVGNWQLVS